METAAPRESGWFYYSVVAIWLALVGAGMHLLWLYKTTPGVAATAPAAWPAGTRLTRAANGPTLLMFAHPRCSCTRASLAELSKLTARQQGLFHAKVLFALPEGAQDHWLRSDIVRRAYELEGVEVGIDAGGFEARQFGSATSGQVLLYSSAGRLLFSGGITGSRGHEGDNLGRARVAALIRGAAADRPVSAVFGCAIQNREQR
jgi:hypothetical protein